MLFKISVKENLVGKTNISDQLGVWEPATMTPRDLAQWAFFEHKGYCHGVFDNERWLVEPDVYKTARANAFFIQAEVVTIDIDAKDFELYPEQKEKYTTDAQLDALLQNDFIKKHAFLIVPSSGQKLPEKPNWHLSFALSEPITNTDEYRLKALEIASHIGVPTDQQTCKAAQLTAGTLYKNRARHVRGYSIKDIYINDNAERIDVASLTLAQGENIVLAEALNEQHASWSGAFDEGENANERVIRHFKHTPEVREQIVLECLSVILPTLDATTGYEKWSKVWMSAHHGSPTPAVRDYILSEEHVVWSDGNRGKRKFYRDWETHIPSGITVASLFFLAHKAGWLNSTGYEVDPMFAETIDVMHIGDWLDSEKEIPPRVLIQSQTGSGKTESIIRLYARLGQPKTVIFVPTIKLATGLHATLFKAGIPAVLYIETKTGIKLSHQEFIEAQVLVTTLQSFGMIAFKDGHSMAEYGLVYVEESDQLIAQFARGGGGTLFASSHVSDSQARVGFRVLNEALKYSGYVWLVDATMTKVSWELASRLSKPTPRFILNEQVREKATVQMLDSKDEAMSVVQDALKANKRVVVACDTRTMAQKVVSVMTTLGLLKSKRSIILTKDSEHLADTQTFMKDVEVGAASFDLVVYNSVMASGVSITQTTPDVFVQFCSFLSPRANLQMLNRYRSQAKVYCWYEDTEGLYAHTQEEIYTRAGHAFDLETRLVAVPAAKRSTLTELRATIASISVADESMQRRSPKSFYRVLLRADGRKVVDLSDYPTDIALDMALKREKKVGKDRQNHIHTFWRAAKVVDATTMPPEDATELEINMGRLKSRILAILQGVLPQQETGDIELMDAFFNEHDDIPKQHRTFDRFVAEVYEMFKGKDRTLGRLVDQSGAVTRSEKMLLDEDKAITSLSSDVTELEALRMATILLPEIDGYLPAGAEYDIRSKQFVTEVTVKRDLYDQLFHDGNYAFDAVMEKKNPAFYFGRALLSKVGLKLVKPRKHASGDQWQHSYHVANFDLAQRLLSWRYRETPISLTDAWRSDRIKVEVERNKRAGVTVSNMSPGEQARLEQMVREENVTSRWYAIVEATGWI